MPPPSGTVPPVPSSDGRPGLTIEQLGLLRQAGRWGLLRAQSGKRYLLSGAFSLPAGDLTEIIRAAGGNCVEPLAVQPNEDWMRSHCDVLVCGDGASKRLSAIAFDAIIEELTEAELVRALLPSVASLLAQPTEPPF